MNSSSWFHVDNGFAIFHNFRLLQPPPFPRDSQPTFLSADWLKLYSHVEQAERRMRFLLPLTLNEIILLLLFNTALVLSLRNQKKKKTESIDCFGLVQNKIDCTFKGQYVAEMQSISFSGACYKRALSSIFRHHLKSKAMATRVPKSPSTSSTATAFDRYLEEEEEEEEYKNFNVCDNSPLPSLLELIMQKSNQHTDIEHNWTTVFDSNADKRNKSSTEFRREAIED
ncbi:hypothetical protein T10_7243 [Trichinella papuae]|uniref:Uncharacterized protein n=1 Tax=Trichinella papuae TaxID=268474 RepID=A0A0V1N4R3_9BILA|nr:hypothetical protein T10_7243 [Trichinella papuae]